jgi:hypothetical protein
MTKATLRMLQVCWAGSSYLYITGLSATCLFGCPEIKRIESYKSAVIPSLLATYDKKYTPEQTWR